MDTSKFITGLAEVKNLINSNNLEGPDGALAKFENCIKEIIDIGSYTDTKWDYVLRAKVYEFGETFKEKDPCKFIDILDKFQSSSSEKTEFLEFIRSEIIWNYFPLRGSLIPHFFKELIEQYPFNPEFHHSYSHYLEAIEEYENSIAESRLALKMENQNHSFLSTCFDREKRYFNILLKQGEIDTAEKVAQNMFSMLSDRKNYYVYNNIINSLIDRVEDHRVIESRINEINKIIYKEAEKERKKLIEILSIFVGILSFIFININILLSNLDKKGIVLLMIAMADILIIFAVAISYLFSSKETNDGFWSFAKHRKFWVLVILITILIIIYKIT